MRKIQEDWVKEVHFEEKNWDIDVQIKSKFEAILEAFP